MRGAGRGSQMSPGFRRPPPGATDVLCKLATWWPPTGFAAGRDNFRAPGQPLDTGQLGPPLTRGSLRGGASLAVYRTRLAEASKYVRVGRAPLLPPSDNAAHLLCALQA